MDAIIEIILKALPWLNYWPPSGPLGPLSDPSADISITATPLFTIGVPIAGMVGSFFIIMILYWYWE